MARQLGFNTNRGPGELGVISELDRVGHKLLLATQLMEVENGRNEI